MGRLTIKSHVKGKQRPKPERPKPPEPCRHPSRVDEWRKGSPIFDGTPTRMTCPDCGLVTHGFANAWESRIDANAAMFFNG